MAKKYDFDDSDGVWRTVGGRRIFIRNGQDLASAMVESGKFKNLRSTLKKQKEKDKEEEKKKEKLTDSDEDKEIKGRMKELQREIDSGRNNEEKTERLKDELQQYEDKYEKVNGEEKERLEIAKDIAKEVYGLNEKNASPERIEKEARRILEPNDGEVLEKGDQPYTNSKGELERSTKSLKEWRDELKKTKEPRDELAEASGGVISTLKTSIPASKAERIKPGIEIYYKGDQANTPGYFTVESFDPSKEQFMSSITLKEKGGEGRTKKISAQQIEDSYTNNYASRFAFKEDYDNFRNSVFEGYAKKYGTKTENKSTNETMNNAIREKASKPYKIDTTKLKGETYKMPERTAEEKASDERYGNAKVMYKLTGDEKYKKAYQDEISRTTERIRNKVEQEKASEKTNSQFEVSDLKAKALTSLPKDHIATHDSDLYIKKTKESDALLENMKNKNSGLLSTFKDQKTGETWYDIPFANMADDYKEKTNNNSINNSLRQKAYQKYLKEHPASKMSFEDFKDMRKK